MVKNVLRKCLLVTCIFITLCPKRGRFDSEEEIIKRNNNNNKYNNNFNVFNSKYKKNLNNYMNFNKDKTNVNNNVRTNDNDNDNTNDINNNDNSNDNDHNNNNSKDYDNDNNNANNNKTESDGEDIFVSIGNNDNINANNDIAEKGENKDITEKAPGSEGHNLDDLNTTLDKLKLTDEDRKKLKDVMKDAAVTFWTGLQNAEPGFDLDANEMEKFNIWPRGDIPYYIDEYSFDPTLQTRIRDVVVAVNSVTGLHFNELRSPPIDSKTRFVFFINRRGVLPCVDYTNKNFTNEGVQKVVLGYDCLSAFKSLGSLILALAGVPPQHNSPDRDEHLILQTDNIIPDKTHLFEKIPDNEWLFHDVDYDYNSAGHYDLFQYTANGKATIKLSKNDATSLGNEGLSYGDLWKIRMLYNYISRNRPTIGKSECSKLFVPGSKFSKYRPDSDEDITPRKKPNKYLGINNEQEPENNSSEEKPKKLEESIQGVDSKAENDEQSGSDEQPNKLNHAEKPDFEDYVFIGNNTDEKDKTIFRIHSLNKRT